MFVVVRRKARELKPVSTQRLDVGQCTRDRLYLCSIDRWLIQSDDDADLSASPHRHNASNPYINECGDIGGKRVIESLHARKVDDDLREQRLCFSLAHQGQREESRLSV